MRIGVIGCAGRMGRANLREIVGTPGLVLAGGVERPGHPDLGTDLGLLAGLDPVGAAAGDDVAALVRAAEAVIEFSTPAATLANAALCAEAGCAQVVGTTGLSPEQETALRRHAERVAIVLAPNLSLGVNLLLGLVEQAARALGPGFDIEVLEMHHRQKVDAPSGTAIALGRAAARGRGVDLGKVGRRARDGITGARETGEIGFAALRGGDVVGDHKVMFAGLGERLELGHIATDRGIYSRGAVRAARWTASRPPGLYGMAEVLGLGPTGAAAIPPP